MNNLNTFGNTSLLSYELASKRFAFAGLRRGLRAESIQWLKDIVSTLDSSHVVISGLAIGSDTIVYEAALALVILLILLASISVNGLLFNIPSISAIALLLMILGIVLYPNNFLFKRLIKNNNLYILVFIDIIISIYKRYNEVLIMKKEPVRLHKKPDKKPLIENGMIAGIPLEFVLITLIMVCFFGLIIAFMGPATESGMWFNAPHA